MKRKFPSCLYSHKRIPNKFKQKRNYKYYNQIWFSDLFDPSHRFTLKYTPKILFRPIYSQEDESSTINHEEIIPRENFRYSKVSYCQEFIQRRAFLRSISIFSKLKSLEVIDLMLPFRRMASIGVNRLTCGLVALKKLQRIQICILSEKDIFNDRCIFRIFRNISVLPKLRNIAVDIDRPSNFNFDFGKIKRKISRLNNLETISVPCIGISKPTTISLSKKKPISQNLKPKSLQAVEILLPTGKVFEEGTISSLCSVLDTSKMQNLSLYFESSRFSSNSDLPAILSTLNVMHGLLELSIHFKELKFQKPGAIKPENIPSENDLIILSESIAELKSLKNLSLKFGSTALTAYGLEALFIAISKIKNLLNLKLLCYSQSSISCSEVKVNIEKSLSKLSQLRNLELLFVDGTSINDMFLTSILKSLSSLKIESFKAGFGYEKITKEPYKLLGQNIANVSCLKNLDLSFHSKITETTVIKILGSLFKLKLLESLTLRFSDFNISDKGLLLLSINLKVFQNLKSLNLGFRGCIGVTLLSIQEMMKKIPLQKAITEFQFLFFWNGLDNTILEWLSTAIGNLNNLKTLSLKFYPCLDDLKTGYEKLIKAISSLKKLNSLSLKLGISSGGIPPSTLKILVRSIEILPELKSLVLDLSETETEVLNNSVEFQLLRKLFDKKSLESIIVNPSFK